MSNFLQTVWGIIKAVLYWVLMAILIVLFTVAFLVALILCSPILLIEAISNLNRDDYYHRYY